MRLIAVVALVAAAGVVLPAASATAATEPAVHVELSPITPVLTPGHDLTVTITVSNPTTETVGRGSLDLTLDPDALTTRDALDDWLDDTDAAAEGPSVRVDVPTLLPAGTSTVSATIPAAALGLTSAQWGARGLAATFDVDGDRVAAAHGSVVWYASQPITPTPVTITMPLTAPAAATGLLSADDLAALTRAGGLLTRELDGVTGRSVAIGIDPMIIASIRALGTSAPASATDWLARLRALPNETFALAYADADLAVQSQAGLEAPLAPTSLAYAMDAANFPPADETATPAPTESPTGGVPGLDALLAWPYSQTGIAWPGSGTVAAKDVPALAAAGYATTIVDSSDLADAPTTTPRASATSGENSVLLADTRLSRALSDAATAVSDADWQAAISEAASVLAVASGESSDAAVIAALERGWPPTSTRLPETIDTVLALPWVESRPLSTTRQEQPTAVTLTSDGEASSRVAVLNSLITGESDLAAFSSVLDDPTILTGDERNRILGLLSVGWLPDSTGWAGAVAEHRAATAATLASVALVQGTDVLVVGSPTEILFTVKNQYTHPVNVRVHVVPSNGRLVIDNDAEATVEANSSATVRIPVRAQIGSGGVQLTATLLSPTGVQLGVPSTVEVNVQADWEGFGAVAIATIVVIVFGVGVWRSVRRRRHAREEEAAAAASGRAVSDEADSEGVSTEAENGDAESAGGDTTETAGGDTTVTADSDNAETSDSDDTASPEPEGPRD
jgi:hypothetical protein